MVGYYVRIWSKKGTMIFESKINFDINYAIGFARDLAYGKFNKNQRANHVSIEKSSEFPGTNVLYSFSLITKKPRT